MLCFCFGFRAKKQQLNIIKCRAQFSRKDKSPCSGLLVPSAPFEPQIRFIFHGNSNATPEHTFAPAAPPPCSKTPPCCINDAFPLRRHTLRPAGHRPLLRSPRPCCPAPAPRSQNETKTVKSGPAGAEAAFPAAGLSAAGAQTLRAASERCENKSRANTSGKRRLSQFKLAEEQSGRQTPRLRVKEPNCAAAAGAAPRV